MLQEKTLIRFESAKSRVSDLRYRDSYFPLEKKHNKVARFLKSLLCRLYLSLFGLATQAWDDRGSTLLSAVTAGIRSSWMSAIRKAANLPDPDSNVDSLAVCPDTQQEPNPQSPTT